MTRTQLFPLFLFLTTIFASQAFAQQTATIHGTVTDTDQSPVSGVHVRLADDTAGDVTNMDGHYQIPEVPAGTHTLVISGVGFTTQETGVQVQPGETLTVDVTLSMSEEELQEIVVRSSSVNKYTREISPYVGKMPISNLSNPQVYNTISSDLMADQVVTSVDDALKNAPGLIRLWESTGRGGDGAGYYSLRGFSIQPTMVNGLPSLTNGTLDPASVEAIEVIKGPSGTLYGSNLISYGGLINVVTKKPYQTFGGDLSYQTGSYGLNRMVVDVNTPVKANRPLAVRAISSYHLENSFQDAGLRESFFIAPSISYEASDDLSFLIQTEYLDAKQTNPTMLFLNRSTPLAAENLSELDYNPNLSYTSNDLTIDNPAFSLQGEMTYHLSEQWTSQTVLSRSSARANGYYSYLWDLATQDRTYVRYINRQNSTTIGTDIQQNFTGTLQLGPVQNQLVAGVDFYEERTVNNSTGYIGFDQISLEDPSTSPISRSAVDAQLQNAAISYSTTRQQIYSAYLSNLAELTPRLSVLASLRVDHFKDLGELIQSGDTYSQTALSPKFGLVYQPIQDKISLFANYMNGFSNVSPRVQQDGSTRSFRPEQANQWEAGVKSSLLNGRLVTTASYYDIQVRDVVREDPNRANFYVQDGENYSRGLELSMTASPVPGLNMTAGYSYNLSEVTKTDNADYLGRRPEEAGPEHLANGWISYLFQQGALQNIGFGFGGNYIGENPILNRASTGTFTLPAYTILNGSVFYNSDNYRLALKVDNLTDREYYTGWSTVNPQQPRSIKASFTYKF